MTTPEHDAGGSAFPRSNGGPSALDVFSACPASIGDVDGSYLDTVRKVSEWSERHGCRGMLIYSDNRLVDPWMVSQVVLANTRTLAPLVAVQPVYMHPYTVAKMVATIAALYSRRIFINWVAGGFKNDLAALADGTPHDSRYDRLVEYATLVRELTDGETVTFEGRYYEARGLKLEPPVYPALRPEFVLAGSSPAGKKASRDLGARSVTYALPSGEGQSSPDEPGLSAGLRVGIIARASRDEAWRIAYLRFPPERKGALMRGLARKVSDSHWHERLCREAEERAGSTDGVYWMGPFDHYRTMCPYLVGDHGEVAAEIGRHIRYGYRTFILDEPDTEADLANARLVFDRALQGAAAVR